jgi:cysteine sulfinate desulfinase/cysteine desulfurase-like protein
MDVEPEVGMGAIRFSFGRGTTGEDLDAVVAGLTAVLTPSGIELRR